MMNEHCWVLIGGWREDLWWGKRVRPSEGAPASVAFNAEYVLERDAKYHDVIGFIHTHPSFTAHYSSRDDRTMKAWVLALGKPLVCCIIGTDGLRAWWYLNDEDPPIEYQAKTLRGIVFGMTPEEFFDEKEEGYHPPSCWEKDEEEVNICGPAVEGTESGSDAAEPGIKSGSEGCSG